MSFYSAPKSVPPSHQPASCGYCNKTVRRDKLPHHIETTHGKGLPVMEKGDVSVDRHTPQMVLEEQRENERLERDNRRQMREQQDREKMESLQSFVKDLADSKKKKEAQQQKQKDLVEQQRLEKEERDRAAEAEAERVRILAEEEKRNRIIAEIETGESCQPQLSTGSESIKPTETGACWSGGTNDHEVPADPTPLLALPMDIDQSDYDSLDSTVTKSTKRRRDDSLSTHDEQVGVDLDFPMDGSVTELQNQPDMVMNTASKTVSNTHENLSQEDLDYSHKHDVDADLTIDTQVLTKEHFDAELEKKMDELRVAFERKLELEIEKLSNSIGTKMAVGSTQMQEDIKDSKDLPDDRNKLTDSDKRGMMSKAKDIDAITRIYPEFEKYYNEDGTLAGLKCRPCTELPGTSGRQLGFLTYNAEDSLDTEQTDTRKMSRGFSNIKSKVGTHVDSASHQKSTNEFEKLEAINRAQAVRNEVVGVRVARCALKASIEGKSESQFEIEVAHLAACGVDVGEINHSKAFPSEMIHHFSDALKEQMQINMEKPHPASDRPPPFSVISDAMTPNRDTLQLTGIITNLDGEQTDLFLKASILKSHAGDDMAKAMHEDLKTQLGLTDAQLKKRITGIAGDGQYIRHHVTNKLAGRIGIDDPIENDLKEERWLSRHWDPAHQIELAEKDAKEKGKETEWVQQTQQTISKLNQKHRIGKKYRALVEKAAEDGGIVRAPNSFSTTRFASYSHTVLDNFDVNYPALYGVLDENGSTELSKIDNAPFVLRAVGLTDVYSEIGKMSKEVQNPKNYPWIVSDALERGITALENISTELSESGTQNFSHMKKFSEAAEEICTSSSYKDKPLSYNVKNVSASSGTRSRASDPSANHASAISAVDSAKKEISLYANKFCKNLKARVNESAMDNKVTQLANASFSMNSILNSDTDQQARSIRDASFKKYVDLAHKAEYLEAEKSVDSVVSQYEVFSDRLLDTIKDKLEPSQLESDMTYKISPKEEREIYQDFVKNPKNFEECKDVGHLLLSGMTRTHCEAVVEGMGNILDQRIEKRGKIALEKLSEETFVDWNSGNSAAAPERFLVKSLEKRFGCNRADWHFTTKTKQTSKLQVHATSKTVDRIRKEEGRIKWENN